MVILQWVIRFISCKSTSVVYQGHNKQSPDSQVEPLGTHLVEAATMKERYKHILVASQGVNPVVDRSIDIDQQAALGNITNKEQRISSLVDEHRVFFTYLTYLTYLL